MGQVLMNTSDGKPSDELILTHGGYRDLKSSGMLIERPSRSTDGFTETPYRGRCAMRSSRKGSPILLFSDEA
jgi:hypothetical protein